MYGYGYGAPVAGCAAPVAGVGHGGGFALIVVLFILLIIVGAAYVKPAATAPVTPC
ncbi:YjcZ family sporulation protein [Alkalihalobacillus sp. LMS39]|uniref:YjcZ family sporulation protein n=1 Tax=Alkalihalobacillus sp. LMS39 TaxID=2924032 RepID=UPI001FB1CDD1|nr:YjcZ family sporulation protein [Alkalihalobacillus sp. LMS39]UOE94463.1 YjcZ family sporulation protein [Alkalihalobacillus sp. LMS39]